jgi:hypothetical protein
MARGLARELERGSLQLSILTCYNIEINDHFHQISKPNGDAFVITALLTSQTNAVHASPEAGVVVTKTAVLSCLLSYFIVTVSANMGHVSRVLFALFVQVSRCCRLDGELELLALHDLGVVDVEEVAVQDGLNDTGDNGNGVDLVVCLRKVSVDPVGNVESAVAAEGEEVVGGDGLGLTSSLKHKELGKNGHRLEPDGKGPQNLGKGIVVGEDDSKDSGSSKEVLDAEGVDIGIVGRLVGVGHEVDDVTLRAKEEDFEDEVVDAVGREKIEIASDVDKHVEGLRLEGDT